MSESRRSSNVSDGPNIPRSEASGLRPLAPRLPVAAPASLAIRSLPLPTVPPSRAPLPCQICFRVGCRLTTHLSFRKTVQSMERVSRTGSSPSQIPRDKGFAASYAYTLGQQYVDTDVASSKVDPFYNLPVTANFDTPEMHRLFHDWFTIEAHSTFRIARPSEMAGDYLCSAFFMPALQDSALCLSILATSAAIVPSRSGLPARNITSLTLVGEAMQQMRSRINTSPEHISDVTIVAATFLWAVNAWLEDADAMKSHGHSVHAFVKNRGGLHKLGMVGAVARVVSWVDVLHSMIFTEPCFFLDPPVPDSSLQSSPQRYGTFWASPTVSEPATIEPDIHSVCQETCHMIELVESADVKQLSPTEYIHILESIRGTYNRGSLLRTKHQDAGNLDECISLAITLVKNKCFYGGSEIKILIRIIANRLVKAIKATGGPSFWQQNLDLLIWLLFNLAMVPNEYEGKAWCRDLLCQAVASRFCEDDEWPSSWKADLKQCLGSFAWSDVRFARAFDKVCRLITRTRNIETSEDEEHEDDDENDRDPEREKGKAVKGNAKPEKPRPVKGKKIRK